MGSDWKQSGINRRDERHTAVDDEPRRVPGKKDRKRWCKGKVGREHDFKTVEKEGWHQWSTVDKCVKCGKERNWTFRVPWL